jgi:hypothetical protein
MLAVLQVGDGFPSGLLATVALPLDKIVSDVVESASFEYLLDLPLGIAFHNNNVLDKRTILYIATVISISS